MTGDVHQVSFLPGHPISYTTSKLELLFNDQLLSVATGFVMQFGQSYGLVTNWHVLSGKNAITGRCLSYHGGIPNRITFHVTLSSPGALGPDKSENLFFKPMSLKLYKDDHFLDPIWIDSRFENSQDDFCIIHLNDHIPELQEPGARLRAIHGGKIAVFQKPKHKLPISEVKKEDVHSFYPSIGRQVFIAGYPAGIEFSGVFPIWKGATVASEPMVPTVLSGYITEDVFLVDGLTRSGMSGSPVICLPDAGEVFYSENGGKIIYQNKDPLLIGVYAGREGVTAHEADLALGRVWKVGAIQRLFMK